MESVVNKPATADNDSTMHDSEGEPATDKKNPNDSQDLATDKPKELSETSETSMVHQDSKPDPDLAQNTSGSAAPISDAMTSTAPEKDGITDGASGEVNTGEVVTESMEASSEQTEKVKDLDSEKVEQNKQDRAAAQPEATSPEASGASSSNGATASSGNSSNNGASNGSAPLQSVYHIKWIKYKGDLTPVVTQNENGPCPLLAIMNVLLLKGKVKLPPMVEMVTSGQLMEYLADCIFEHAPKNIAEDADMQLNYEQNMHDAMATFHKLQTGLDVNVRFTGVNNFEYTSECIVFDLLGIPLYHGWLADPEDPNEVAAIGNCSYNQLVEKVIAQKQSTKAEMVTEALQAEDFLNRTAHQLTYHGLLELATTLKEEEMAVFFRNNHFSTVYKHKDELFLLVTDQGFLTESNVVWETLANVEGDCHFVDANFHTYRKAEPSTAPIPTPMVNVGSDQQIDQDYLVALSLQQEQQQYPPQQQAAASGTGGWQQKGKANLTDHELALQLKKKKVPTATLR